MLKKKKELANEKNRSQQQNQHLLKFNIMTLAFHEKLLGVESRLLCLSTPKKNLIDYAGVLALVMEYLQHLVHISEFLAEIMDILFTCKRNNDTLLKIAL